MKKSFFILDGERNVLLILIYSIICPLLFRDSNIAKLMYDILLLFLTYFVIIKKSKIKITLPIFFGFLYIAVCIVSAYVNGVSLIQFWWNARSSFTCLLFLIVCQLYVKETTVEKVKNIFVKLNDINFLFILVEALFGYRQDFLGGIFGTFIGCNSLLNSFMIMTSIISMAKFQNSRIKVSQFVRIIAENCIIAALAELKIYYVELVIILVVLIFYNRFSLKNIAAIVFCFSIVFLGINILYRYNPDYLDFFKIQNMIESFDLAYADNFGLSRGKALDYISKTFLLSNRDKLLGIGFGNAVFSSMSFLSSEFYSRFAYLKYNWFCHSYKFLESGYLGMITFLLMWISPVVSKGIKCTDENRSISRATSIICILLFVYNTSLMNLYIIFILLFFISCIYAKPVKNDNNL